MRVVRVEQRLGCQSLLDDAEGRGEYDNRGPATTPAAYHFPDQESAAAVERNEQHQGRQRGQGHIAEEEFGHKWSGHQKQQYRSHPRPPAGTSSRSGCMRCRCAS